MNGLDLMLLAFLALAIFATYGNLKQAEKSDSKIQ
jgi:hypothetical protein